MNTRLTGRDPEVRALAAMLAAVRAGESRALIVRGEPGVGKTALLDDLAARAADFTVVRAAGVEAEMELPFAGLHQLCAPLLDHAEQLPAPQRDALLTTFGLSTGRVPNRFFVGLATLTLLSETARTRPLVCLVDDAQWLDHASQQTLAFVGRRLLAESVALVFAARDEHELVGLPELVLHGLRNGAARALLRSAIPVPLDAQVSDRIVAETRGNPLALLELPRGLSAAQLAGGFRLPGAVPLSGRIEESFRRQLAALPTASRALLLVAAAEPIGDPVLVWRAAERLGIDPQAAAAVELGGLCEFGSRVSFRHPLARSAIYRGAPPDERRAVHRALAEATDERLDPDRRAWHRAEATAGLDEDVAGELERSAGRAQERGGLAAAAAFLERAAALTPDPGRRGERTLAAAEVQLRAGDLDAVRRLVTAARAAPLDALGRARTDLLHGQVAFASSRGREAPPLLLKAAEQLGVLEPELARETYLDAFSAAVFVGRLGEPDGVRAVAEVARGSLPASPAGPGELLLDGVVRLVTDGYAAGVSRLARLVPAFLDASADAEPALHRRWLASHTAAVRWDFDGWRALVVRHVEVARAAGALTELTIALGGRTGIHLLAGELSEAAALVDEVATISAATGNRVAAYSTLPLAAFAGQGAQASHLIEAGLAEVFERGEGMSLSMIDYSAALIDNAMGRYDEALAVLGPTAEHPAELWFPMVLPEIIEAAVRSGQRERGRDPLRRLTERTQASGTDWALGIGARASALMSFGDVAADLYQEAIERLDRAGVRAELARTELLYGEWLRRERRGLVARDHLRVAYEMFTTMGMDAFAERTARELSAAGATAARRPTRPGTHLTPQESQIARLAVDGLSNSEIGERLFISARTVQYHLGKVFTKLDITSRTQLHRVLNRDR